MAVAPRKRPYRTRLTGRLAFFFEKQGARIGRARLYYGERMEVKMRVIAALSLVIFLGAVGAASGEDAQPYAGWHMRPIKALSDEQIADLHEGRGMGLALAAEVNGYPGPRHVIDLAEPLGLSGEQLDHVQGLFEAMRAEAIRIGRELIAGEAELERQFAERTITPETLNALTSEIGAVQASLRAAHLKYHLLTLAALTPEQTAHYGMLRGYGSTTGGHQHGGHSEAH